MSIPRAYHRRMDVYTKTEVLIALSSAANDDTVPRAFPVLTPGSPLETSVRCQPTLTALARLDRLIQLYYTLSACAQHQVDLVALNAVKQVVPHHQMVAQHFDPRQDIQYRLPNKRVVTLPLPAGLVCLGSLVIAADAALDLLEQEARDPQIERWRRVYVGLLKRTLNRTLDAAFQQRANRKQGLNN